MCWPVNHHNNNITDNPRINIRQYRYRLVVRWLYSRFFLNGQYICYCKICIIEICLLKYYFKSHLIYKGCYYSQTIFNQLNIMVPYVDIIGLGHSVAILEEIYVMRRKCHVRWLHFSSAC